jgi:glycine cleavage system H protein
MSDKFPQNLRYTKDHEWALIEGNQATIGITHHAQDALGEIVYVELPKVGKALNKGDTFGVVESIKAVSDLYSPLSGKVVAVNSGLPDEPGAVNSEPYKKAWMMKLDLSKPAEVNELLDASSYQKLVESL